MIGEKNSMMCSHAKKDASPGKTEGTHIGTLGSLSLSGMHDEPASLLVQSGR